MLERISLPLQFNDMIVFLSKELYARILNDFKTESKCKLILFPIAKKIYNTS